MITIEPKKNIDFIKILKFFSEQKQKADVDAESATR
jgi:hypothetical protein